MKALRQLGFFKLPFRQDEPTPEAEDDRVLALFRNRAELKKAHGELQEEIYRLKDRIKQQEGATSRVQEMLNALEVRLGMPESAYPAVVFYQLRRLWQSGREIIEQFVADLVRQQEERERTIQTRDDLAADTENPSRTVEASLILHLGLVEVIGALHQGNVDVLRRYDCFQMRADGG